VNDLEQKAFDNEKKVQDIEHNLQAHILQYHLHLKQQRRKSRASPTSPVSGAPTMKRFMTITASNLVENN